jgi:hypothetical protein
MGMSIITRDYRWTEIVRDILVEPARQAQCNDRVDESLCGDFSQVLIEVSIALARRGNPEKQLE